MADSRQLFGWIKGGTLMLCMAGALTACSGGGSSGRNRTDDPPPPANVSGDTFAITSNARLISFNRASGALAAARNISGLTAGDTLLGFDIRPRDNSLIAVANSGRIYRIDPSNAAATLVVTLPAGTIASNATSLGVDFNPVPDRLRIVASNGQNLRIDLNVASGAPIMDGSLRLDGLPALGIVGASYNNNFINACRTQLFYLDTDNNRLLTTSAPNEGILSVVGALGVTTSDRANGFEFFTAADGSSTAAVVLTIAGNPTVYSLDVSTGTVRNGARIGGLRSGELVIGIAASTPAAVRQPLGELTGLTTDNQLFTFDSAAPNKLCSGPTPITGLARGENVVGIDVRPADGHLYGVGVTAGGAGRVFQIDRASGVISAAQTLSSSGAALTLQGSNFGVDFNPVSDQLRLISERAPGQNLSIDVSNGATSVDGTTGGNISAAAHTNSFGPTAPSSTTLYTINPATGMLNIQDPLTQGTQRTVAALSLPNNASVSAVRGFDINGVNNLAFAALQVSGSSTTTLYAVDLASGAATPFTGGNIGAGVQDAPLLSSPLRGLTLTSNPQVELFAVTASGNQLVTFSPTANLGIAASLATFTTLPITGLQGGETIVGADFRTSTNTALNHRLYVLTDQGRAYVLDPQTGAVSQQQLLMAAANDPFAGFMGARVFGMDFIPNIDRLRILTRNRSLRTVLDGVAGQTPGATTTEASFVRPRPFSPLPIPIPPTVLAAAYSNSTPGVPAAASQLFTIEGTSSALAVQFPADSGVQIVLGNLGVSAFSSGGFDITGRKTAFAVLNTSDVMGGPAGLDNGLYAINLGNGAATLVGAVVNAGGAITGMALPVSASDPVDGSTLVTAVVEGRRLIQFPSTPAGVAGPLTTDIPIIGLADDDWITDIDFLPSTATAPPPGMAATPATSGMLYAIAANSSTGTGNVYLISARTGVATLIPQTLDPVPGASGAGNGTLSGSSFVADFDPTTGRLRVLSNSTENSQLTVSPTLALVRSDQRASSFNQDDFNMVAAGYTNAFLRPATLPSPAITTLFAIDSLTNSLQRRESTAPMGILTTVGRLDPAFNFTSTASLDIVGGDNGLALAILQRTGGTPMTTAAQSSLYRIDLATGAATLIGDIGSAANPLLMGSLALRLR